MLLKFFYGIFSYLLFFTSDLFAAEKAIRAAQRFFSKETDITWFIVTCIIASIWFVVWLIINARHNSMNAKHM